MIAASGATCCVNSTSPLNTGGPVDDRILGVWLPIFVISVVVAVVVSGLIVYAALRFRRKSDDEEPVQFHGNARLEVAWTVLPLITLLSLFGWTAANMQYIHNAPAGSMQVKVVAQQYTWTFDYTGKQRQNGKDVSSVTDFNVPADTPVALTVVSTDVNHSLYIPNLAGQVNAIPGQNNYIWFQAKQGDYYGQCTELCGVGHAGMLLVVHALPRDKFDQWLSQQMAR